MLVEKVTDAIQHPQSMASDSDQDKSDFEVEEEKMSKFDELDDLVTLDQYQHSLRKEMLARKGHQTMLYSQKKKKKRRRSR